jgi:hypothetical protein
MFRVAPNGHTCARIMTGLRAHAMPLCARNTVLRQVRARSASQRQRIVCSIRTFRCRINEDDDEEDFRNE